LRDSHAATIMPLPRCQIPILTVAGLIQIAALQRSRRLQVLSSTGFCYRVFHVMLRRYSDLHIFLQLFYRSTYFFRSIPAYGDRSKGRDIEGD
jgi:hypothetical protein